MNEKLLRLAWVFEFLVALVAIFTAWSEIGGQGALDLMPWGWKFGFSFALAGTLVAYTIEIHASESWWTLRSARWVAAIVVTMVAMGIVTYFYALQADAGESDEGTTISRSLPAPQFSGHRS